MVRAELVHEGVAKGQETDIIAQSLGVEIEPMCLLDRSGSMIWSISETDSTPRKDVVREAFGGVVARLAAEDSQADEEDEGAGGLRTVAFGSVPAIALDNLNPGNLNQKWSTIPFSGGTRIIPGWNELVDQYMEEFGNTPPAERPIMLVLVVTDGEAEDAAEFGDILAQASGGVYIAVAILGYGDVHDRTVAQYKAIADVNSHVKVESLGSETDSGVIADALLRMIA